MSLPDKHQVLRDCIRQLEAQLEELEAAARASAALATDAEHRARSKYETFSLETSYLARGQAQRVEGLREICSQLKAFRMPQFSAEEPVKPGALVEVMDEKGDNNWYLLVPVGGGETVQSAECSVFVISLQSPIAKALLGKRVGDLLIFGENKLYLTEVC